MQNLKKILDPRIIALILCGLVFGAAIVHAAPGVVYQTTLLPLSDNLYDLGTSSDRWRNLYVNNVTVSGTCSGCGSGTGSPGGTTGQLQYNGSGSVFAGVSTTTLIAGTNISYSGGTPVILGSSPITINATGGGSFSGTTGQVEYFSGTNTAVGTSSIFIIPNGNIGIGTTSPYNLLSIGGNVVVGAASAGGTLGDLFLPKLGTAAGTFLAVDATGKVIATSTPAGSGGVSAVTGTYPIISSGGATPAISIAFGTTTSNIWAGTQTFTNSPTFSTLGAGTVNSNALGGIYNTATSSVTSGSGISLTGTAGALVGGTSLTINNTGLLSLQQLGGGTAQTGAITFATSSQTTNGLTTGINITNTAGAFTFAPTLSGTLSVAGGGTNATSFAGSSFLATNAAGTAFIATTSPNLVATAFSTTTTRIYADSNRTDTYTSDGSIFRPYKTIGASIKSYPAAYILAPGTYIEDNLAFTATSTIEGNQATIISIPGGNPGTCPVPGNPFSCAPGSISFATGFIGDNMNIVYGNVFANDTSLSDPSTFQNSLVAGTTTISGLGIFNGGQIGLPGTDGTIWTKANSLTNFLGVNILGTVNAQGTVNLDDDNVQPSQAAGKYAVLATTTGSLLQINGLSLENTSANGGGILCTNGATTIPNSLSSISISVGTTTGIGAINCGTSVSSLGTYSAFSTVGVRLYGNVLALAPFSFAGLNVEGNTLLNVISGLTGVGSSTPWGQLSVNGTAAGTIPIFVAATSTAGFATSTAFEIDSSGNTQLLGGSNLTLKALATAAGAFLAVNSTGQVIATTTPVGGSGITSIGPTGSLQTGPAVTLATSTTAFNGITAGDTITATGNIITFKPSWSGSLNVAGGGTGLTTVADGGVLFGGPGGGTANLTALATSTSGRVLQLDFTTGRPSWVATSTLGITGSGTVNSGTTGQFPYYASNGTALTATSSLFLATSGNIGIGTTTPDAALDVYASSAATNVPAPIVTIEAHSTGTTANGFGPQILFKDAGAFNRNLGGIGSVYEASGANHGGALTFYIADVNGVVTEGGRITSSGALDIATSTLGGLANFGGTNGINLSTATSSWATTGGINISAGCFSIANICISGSGTNYFTNSGASTYLSTGSNLGVGTTTPFSSLSVSTTTQSSGLSSLLAVASTTNATLFNVLGNGNVGVSTTSPSAEVSIDTLATANTGSALRIADRGSTILDVASSSTTRLGVGTTTPWRTLSVTGTVGFDGLTTSSGFQSGVLCLSSTNEVINDSVACLASATRYKEKIDTLTPDQSLAELLQFKPVSFYYKPSFNGALQSNPNYNGEQVGFLAEDLQKIDPRLIILETATTTFEGKEYAPGSTAGVRYEQITAVLTGAIQALSNKIQGIVARLDGAEAKINALQVQVSQQQRDIDYLKSKIH